MKATLILGYLLTFCLIFCFSCSKDSIDEEKQDVFRCFVVKDITSNTAISNAEITLEHFFCTGGPGCDRSVIGVELTDMNGEGCFNLGQRTIDLLNIYCNKEGYQPFMKVDITDDFRVIYLEPSL
jgi:hypothetical protein